MSTPDSGTRARLHPRAIIAPAVLIGVLLLGEASSLLANPTGGAVVAGAATIGAAGKTLTITQGSNVAIIDWQTFSIASGETTKFFVPTSSSATLNRVLSGNPSEIYGTLSSNGQLFLLNPSGIVVGPGGRIDTSSFLGSTLNVSDNEFLNGGDMHFSGSSTAGIDNQGSINATTGNVYLIANQVSNEGALSAPEGNVGLAAASSVLLQQAGDQHLFVQSNPVGTTRAVGVSNAGTVRAASAELRAAGGNAYALAINNTGSIAATGYKKINGQIYLTADTGAISNSGTVRATGSKKGGAVNFASQSGTVTNSGKIDVSATGPGGQGGTVLLGSTQGAVANTGAVDAKGGNGGSGGDVEVSGASVNVGTGVVNTTAIDGHVGMFTIDPPTLTIAPSGGDETGAQVGSQLSTTDVNLDAGTTVTINDGITWTSTFTLTVSTGTSGSSIAINQPISGLAGTLAIDTAGATDQITTGANGSVDVKAFLLENGYWNQNSGTLPAFTASNDFEIQGSSTFLRVTGGNGTSSPYQITDIYGLEGLGSPSTTLLTSNAVLLNDINASATANWNAGAGWTPIGIYDGEDSNDSNAYQGTFNGQGHTISGLTINQPSSSYAGLFGDTGNSATVENVNLTNVSVTGSAYAGGLVGVNDATITSCTSSGTVTGDVYVGGLLGINAGAVTGSSSAGTVIGNANSTAVGGLVGEAQFGSISNSTSSATVTVGSGSDDTGGLVGLNLAPVTNCSTTGSVTGDEVVGGLVGWNESGTITGSGSSSTLNGSLDVGGLVGTNSGSISTSFATGSVDGSSVAGGLVGWNDAGTITTSYATGPVTGLTQIGGFAGTNEGSIANCSSIGAVNAPGFSDQVGGFVGWDDSGTITDSYTTGTITTTSGEASEVGGLVGADSSGTYINAFWDSSTAGVTLGVGTDSSNSTSGVLAASTANLMSESYITTNSTGSPPWDFVNTWTTNGGATTPQLSGVGSGGSIDLLSGTAFTDSGLTFSPNVTITLIFDGSVIGTTQASGTSGAFSFNVSSTDIGSGLVLTDATDKGDTFFQSGSSSTSFSGIDIWGSTLRIIADVASNSALKTAIGSLTGHGVNYSVSGANLSTTSGVNLDIVSNYTIDGNMTSAGTFTAESGANLTGSTTGTLQGTSVSISSGLDDSAALTVHSTSGRILLQDVGSSDAPATVNGLTLNATGAVNIQSCYITLPSGNFSASGSGYTSSSNTNGEANGVNLFDTSILAQGGNITLTGTNGYVTSEIGLQSGLGVGIGTDGETTVTLSTTGSGNITITGICNQNVTSQSYFAGVDIYQDGETEDDINTINVENGKLSITGNVTSGAAAGTGEAQGSIVGVNVESGALVEATGSGSVSITGNTSGATARVNGGNFQFIEGVGVEGTVSVDSGSLTITGTAGTINTSASTLTKGEDSGPVPVSIGVSINDDNGNGSGGLFSGNGSIVSVIGTGGAVVTTGAYTGDSVGVEFSGGTVSDFSISPDEGEDDLIPAISAMTGSAVTITGTGGAVNAGNGANSSDAGSTGVHITGLIEVEDGGSLVVTGIGGSLTASQATPATGNNLAISQGISVNGSGEIDAFGSTPITFVGTGGTVIAGANTAVGSIGVDIGDDNDSETTSIISTEEGLIKITGTGGASPSLGVGVVIHGFNGGGAELTSDDGNIQLNGKGGTGYSGTGAIAGNYIPNAGVTIVDNSSLSTDGNITITGAGGANSNGVTLNELTTDTTLDESPTLPTLQADSITITSTSGKMLVDAALNANTAVTITSPGALVLDDTSEGTGITTSALTVIAAGPITINDPIATFGAALIESIDGNITLGPNATINDDGGEGENPYVLTIAAGNSLAHSHYLINNSEAGADAITATDGASFYIYSADPTSDMFNGVTVPENNVVFNATYPSSSLPEGNGELFYVATASDTGPNSGNGGTGGGGGGGGGGSTPPSDPTMVASTDDGSGSNVVPPAIVPQNDNGNGQPGNGQPIDFLATVWGGSVTPPFSFTGSPGGNSGGGNGGGWANTSGNGGQVGAGDAAQLGGGGLNNVQNPAAAGALNLALGPAVHNALNQALAWLGDWTDTNYNPADNGAGGAGGGNGETLLNGGDVVVIGGNGVKSIPLSQAPGPLQQALGNGVLNSLPGH